MIHEIQANGTKWEPYNPHAISITKHAARAATCDNKEETEPTRC